jgi:molybdopterin-guanine dinucleotide biosynthesis protein A
MALMAIITAGGRIPRGLASETTAKRKALLSINGKTMLSAALDAVAECSRFNGAVVVGNDDVRAGLPAGIDFVREGETLVDNIQRGFEHLGGVVNNYLIVSPDMPFITADALSSFITAAASSCEIGTPIITRKCFLAAYPGAPNKFLRLAGERQVTMGSCFYLTGHALRSNIPLARDLINMRKHPHRLAILAGLPIFIALVFKRLRLELVEDRASQLTGAHCRALEMDDASIAYDVDNRLNYEYAVAWARREAKPSNA